MVHCLRRLLASPAVRMKRKRELTQRTLTSVAPRRGVSKLTSLCSLLSRPPSSSLSLSLSFAEIMHLNGHISLSLVLGGGFLAGFKNGAGSERRLASEGDRPTPGEGPRLDVSRVMTGLVEEVEGVLETAGSERKSPADPRETSIRVEAAEDEDEKVSVIGMCSSSIDRRGWT
jgi:hypothetical protein